MPAAVVGVAGDRTPWQHLCVSTTPLDRQISPATWPGMTIPADRQRKRVEALTVGVRHKSLLN